MWRWWLNGNGCRERESRCNLENEMKLRMGSGVVVSLCCLTTTPLFISSSSSSAQLRLKPPSSSSSLGARVCCHMAHAESSITTPSSPSPSSAIDFLSICHRLKTTKRAGWLRKEVQNPESVADHMYRMGLMALIAPHFPGVDRDKCVKMAIVHDIAEAIVGDITPIDGIPKEEKRRREQEALDHMCKVLGGGSRAKEIAELWTEYEANSSPEAKFVKDLDKVEMILQALEYEEEQEKDLDEFFQSTAGKFQTEIGKAWAAEIVSRRNKTNDSSHSNSTK